MMNDWENTLLKMQKPGKYLGTEFNRYEKKDNGFRFLLAFPDDYVIGMSSLGYHTVGNIINRHTEFSCERCFAPAVDMESWMRKNNAGLFSLETKSPARDFDMIGFSFQCELTYTNFINMLDLAGIEPYRERRIEKDPVILGGGPSCMNPALLSKFLDIICVGDAEAMLPQLLEKYTKCCNKSDFLDAASEIRGIYVPGRNKSVEPSVFASLDNTYFPVDPPVSLIDIPHNRINIEINRGCRHRCRYCQAAVIYSPYREKTSRQIVEIARKAVASTGHQEIALTSLSATDHSDLLNVMDDLHFAFRDLGVSVVMSSMRPETFTSGISDRLSRLKKGGLTFAPETASQRLKKVINKNVRNEDILAAARQASRYGWNKIKLYFMIGIPGETIEDINENAFFIKDVKKQSGLRVNVTVSPLVPQPHTPFQWSRGVDPEEILGRFNLMRKKSPAYFKGFNLKQYIIESIMVRADEDLADVVYSAWKRGARFDQWKEHFSFEPWSEAFSENGSSWESYYMRDFEKLERLPWDMVHVAPDQDSSRRSYENCMKVVEEETVSSGARICRRRND
ncbi:MAG: radical SAM protein [Elusimicrobiota bacterium]